MMFVDVQNFLSRLCGGEPKRAVLRLDFAFLSRLCGGERAHVDNRRPSRFLSRLCGGEL